MVTAVEQAHQAIIQPKVFFSWLGRPEREGLRLAWTAVQIAGRGTSKSMYKRVGHLATSLGEKGQNGAGGEPCPGRS
jgi:hypothetical protein